MNTTAFDRSGIMINEQTKQKQKQKQNKQKTLRKVRASNRENHPITKGKWKIAKKKHYQQQHQQREA